MQITEARPAVARGGPPGATFAVLLLLTACAALAFPAPFQKWGAFETKALIVPLLQSIMFVMGTRVSLADLRQVFAAPKAVAFGLALQYCIMPLTAAGLAALFRFPPDVAAGVILVGSVCAGNSSNVMTFFAGGNMALSLSMTTISTLLAPLTAPLFMMLLAGRTVQVDFLTLAWSIMKIVVVPVTAGVLAERLLRGHKAAAERWTALAVIAATCLVNAIITANSRDALLSIGPMLVCAEVIQNVAGYGLGYAGARLFGLDRRECITMAMQVGIRNAGLSAGVATDVMRSSNAALASVVYGTVQNASGAILSSLFRRRG